MIRMTASLPVECRCTPKDIQRGVGDYSSSSWNHPGAGRHRQRNRCLDYIAQFSAILALISISCGKINGWVELFAVSASLRLILAKSQHISSSSTTWHVQGQGVLILVWTEGQGEVLGQHGTPNGHLFRATLQAEDYENALHTTIYTQHLADVS